MSLRTIDLCVALGSRVVISDVTLELRAGELTAIIGPNGAGKSTLLRALAGLLQPARGQILLDDVSLNNVDRQKLAQRVGYLPQQRIVHWPLTVERTVALGRMPHSTSIDANARAVELAMVDMDVAQFRDRPVTDLSGGELARVLLARVLAQDTAILLADEPAAGLDPAHQLALLDRFAKLTRTGRTVAVAMHDLSLAARYCQRIVLLKDGRVLADGNPDVVLTVPLLKSAFGIEARIATIDGLPVVLPVGLC
jgi:iron complex transport system ATP-binding protein